jgi:hypothetical protein
MRGCSRWLGVLSVLAVLLSACGSAAPPAQQKNPAAPAPAGQSSTAPASVGGSGAQDAAATSSDRMIVRSGRISLAVSDVPASVDAATTLARRLDGYVASTNVREDNGQQTATLSLRVPGTRYDEAVRELRSLANRVSEESSTGQDVTEEFADLGAQLRNQQAAEAQYLELLKKAQSVEDVLKVQQRLTEVRTQIERLQGRMQVLQRRADLAQIDLTLAADSVGFRPLRYVSTSFAASLQALEVTIGFLIASWWVLLAVGVLIWWLQRRGRRTPPPSEATSSHPVQRPG